MERTTFNLSSRRSSWTSSTEPRQIVEQSMQLRRTIDTTASKFQKPASAPQQSTSTTIPIRAQMKTTCLSYQMQEVPVQHNITTVVLADSSLNGRRRTNRPTISTQERYSNGSLLICTTRHRPGSAHRDSAKSLIILARKSHRASTSPTSSNISRRLVRSIVLISHIRPRRPTSGTTNVSRP